jgi:hypothetical protein
MAVTTKKGVRMRKITISLPEESARELLIKAASRFQTISAIIVDALVKTGTIKPAVLPKKGGARKPG